MRAGTVTALGLGLVLVAGLVNAAALYVPGIALVLLGVVSVAWVRLAASGLRIERRLGIATALEDEPVHFELLLRSGRVPAPSGEIVDPLLSRPITVPGVRRQARLRVRTRFARRGLRRLDPPTVVVRDPLGLSRRVARGADAVQELLVLPRIEPVRSASAGGDGAAGRTGRLVTGAEIDLDGVRPYRTGTPASRIAWQLFARSGDLHERVMRTDADGRPLVVLDLAGTSVEEDADAAVRAAASLCVHLARAGGVSLLLPGERRPLNIGHALREWPRVHALLAVVPAGRGPVAGALGGRRPAILWVSARRLREPPRGLALSGARRRLLIVPGERAGTIASFTVAGCSGYACDRGRSPQTPAGAGETRSEAR